MNEAPPKTIQIRFIHKLQKELASTTHVWEYAISKNWVDALLQFIADNGESSDKVPPLFASDWDDNNLYVGEKNWRVLASWYGVDDRYSFRRRCTISRYISIPNHSHGTASDEGYILADNKLDFITAHFCLLKNLCNEDIKQSYISIYFWESLDYIEFQLRVALKVHPRRNVRMWLSFSDDVTDVLLEDISVFDRHSSSVGAIVCEQYPEVLNVLQKRQCTSSDSQRYAVYGATPVKENLAEIFINNQWKLTLCLELLAPTVRAHMLSTPPHNPAAVSTTVPSVFLNLPLDHFFSSETQHSDWDENLKQLLDDSVSDFSRLITEQKSKVQTRTEELLRTARESYLSQEEKVKAKMEEIAVKENRLDMREKELNERDHELNSKLAKFKTMLTEFLTSKDRFEKEAMQLAQQNAITVSKLELNVGGVRYSTSLATLVKEEGSTLQAMFRGQHALKPDTDGSYFIDRDGTHFRYILNFLRDGTASLQHLPHNDQRLLSELRAEAEHYQLHKMAEALRMRMRDSNSMLGNFASLPT